MANIDTKQDLKEGTEVWPQRTTFEAFNYWYNQLFALYLEIETKNIFEAKSEDIDSKNKI